MGFGGMGNMQKMMKQVQKMQADMAKLQEELGEKTVETSAGGGAVKIVMNGKQEVKEITIDPEILQPEEVEMVQDLLMAAFNEALRKSQDMVSQEMSKITGGMKIPGMF
ncbi:MAG: YbaB/EbfC family nucleoid-associated protein [Bacillota bacterium]|uniref:Nucleoid-associated protein BR63_13710 n=1 Tax=Thermanaerosceptrum fracticalcis TaxID=1712410 RepID=A0A7G6E5A1_THEFR|nr:YbaB/EbfC family nucleoid-associated protein [Thermanaerosceptrum fracticalcis]QNB47255.1 YbaB/EbfC family nucleoid-associated protein [Thermanaerosceptrum fracticalcis]